MKTLKNAKKYIFTIFLIFSFLFFGTNFQLFASDDTDGDLILDDVDKCLGIKGDVNNFGCPILDALCGGEVGCKSGYACNGGYCELKKEVSNSCNYPKNGSSVYGNVYCKDCPCNYNLNFLATLRKCDLIVPAIVSLDGKTIFSKGEPYKLPYSYGK